MIDLSFDSFLLYIVEDRNVISVYIIITNLKRGAKTLPVHMPAIMRDHILHPSMCKLKIKISYKIRKNNHKKQTGSKVNQGAKV